MEKLQTFHKTKQGYIVFGLIELILLYIFASIAIDTANMFAYLASLVLFIGAILNFVNAAKSHNKKGKSKV